MMSWFHGSAGAGDDRAVASAAEIVACFWNQRSILHRLAFLITADQSTAERAVSRACEISLQGSSPFRNWLLEWAKAVTINAAITLDGDAIRMCEVAYKDRNCPHVEHLSEDNNERREANLGLLIRMDARTFFTELDALCRAILVLRIALRSSIQDCSLRLNVSRPAVVVASCHAMTWLDHSRVMPAHAEDNISRRF